MEKNFSLNFATGGGQFELSITFLMAILKGFKLNGLNFMKFASLLTFMPVLFSVYFKSINPATSSM